MTDPLSGPLAPRGLPAALADPPIYAATIAATGYRPASQLARIIGADGVSRLRLNMGRLNCALQITIPRNVWTRFNRACRQADVPNPIRPTAWRDMISR